MDIGSGSVSTPPESKPAPPYAENKPNLLPGEQTETGNPILPPPKSTGNVDVVINGTTINNAVLINSSVWGNAQEIANALGFLYNTTVNAAYINGKWVQASLVNNGYVFLVRDMARAAGIEDCLSWWSDSTGFHVLVNKDLKNAPVKVIRQGNDFTITAYLEFSGNSGQPFPGTTAFDNNGYSYAQIVADSIEKYWSSPNIRPSSQWDFSGNSITVTTSVITKGTQTVSNSQQFVQVVVDNAIYSVDTPSHMEGSQAYDNWSVAGAKTITLYRKYTAGSADYSIDDYMRVAGHEFGHVLGICDAYGAPNGGRTAADITSEVPANDFMRNEYNTGIVTANDVEMAWQAYCRNEWQYFMTENGHVKSSVIGSY